jgi:hypothetical protein
VIEVQNHSTAPTGLGRLVAATIHPQRPPRRRYIPRHAAPINPFDQPARPTSRYLPMFRAHGADPAAVPGLWLLRDGLFVAVPVGAREYRSWRAVTEVAR